MANDFDRMMAKVTVKMLELAADEFGNHGCNDCDLSREIGLTKEEQIALVTYANERNRSPDETPDDIKRLPRTVDFFVMFACKAWAEDLAKRNGE